MTSLVMHMYICVCIYIYIYIYVCVCIYIYTHTLPVVDGRYLKLHSPMKHQLFKTEANIWNLFRKSNLESNTLIKYLSPHIREYRGYLI